MQIKLMPGTIMLAHADNGREFILCAKCTPARSELNQGSFDCRRASPGSFMSNALHFLRNQQTKEKPSELHARALLHNYHSFHCDVTTLRNTTARMYAARLPLLGWWEWNWKFCEITFRAHGNEQFSPPTSFKHWNNVGRGRCLVNKKSCLISFRLN